MKSIWGKRFLRFYLAILLPASAVLSYLIYKNNRLAEEFQRLGSKFAGDRDLKWANDMFDARNSANGRAELFIYLVILFVCSPIIIYIIKTIAVWVWGNKPKSI